MRQAILSRADRSHPPQWRGALIVAAAGMGLVAGIAAGHRAIVLRPDSTASQGRDAVLAIDPAAGDEVRQLQFVTRGGTRVIWTFDSTFDVRARQ
jgi:hypothetical protein